MLEKPNISGPKDEDSGILMEGGTITFHGKVESEVEGAINGGENPVLKSEESFESPKGGTITAGTDKDKSEEKTPTE